MSEENVELVRKALAAFLRADFKGALEHAAPDVVTFRAPPLPDAQTYHGPEGVIQAYADWTADFAEFEMTTGAFIDAGDRVVVEVLQTGKGQASGAVVEGQFWCVYTVVDGTVTRQDVFNAREQALEAAGLGEGSA